MPVEWIENERAPAKTGALSDFGECSTPILRVVLRPNRSLPRKGLAWLLLLVWGLLLVPVIPLVGTVALWVMLPFLLGALWALWYSIERNYRDGELYEELTLWSGLVRVEHHAPGQDGLEWEANPYWVRLKLYESSARLENYVTLKGSGREIELGAFLSPEERKELHERLSGALDKARNFKHPA